MDRPATAATAARPAAGWPTVLGVLLATVLQAVDGSIVNVAVPEIQLKLGGSLGQVSWLVTGYTLASLVAMPLASSLAARVGLWRYFAGSVSLFTLASAGCGWARSVHLLLGFRVLQGLGAGGLLPLAQGVLMSVYTGARRGTAVALVGLAAVLGPLLGPPIGGLLTERFGWPSIFWVNLPLGALSLMLLLRQLRRERGAAPVRVALDWTGAGLLAAFVCCLQLAAMGSLWLVFPAAAALGLFLIWERRVATPVIDLKVLRHRALAGTLVAAALYGLGLYASVFLAPLLLERDLGMRPGLAGAVVSAGGFSSGALIASARPLLSRFRAMSLCTVGAFAFAASMVWMAQLGYAGHGEAVIPQALRGFGTGLLYVGMNGFAFGGVPEEELALASSLFYLLRQLGGTVGVAGCAAVLDRSWRPGLSLCFLGIALAAPVALWPMLRAARSLSPQPRAA